LLTRSPAFQTAKSTGSTICRRGKPRNRAVRSDDYGCGDAGGVHEGVGASVIAGDDPAPVLEPAEYVLEQVALPVEAGVVSDWRLAV
jgi:hypothetical protein